jgi:hypothetical protein
MGEWKANAVVFLVLYLYCTQVFGQDIIVDKQIEVGMEVVLNNCPSGKSFQYIDLYSKTRYNSSVQPNIDSATGNGVYEYYFTPGDFDASRLPCSFSGKKYKVAALHVFEGENGQDKRVMLLYTSDMLKIIWVEFDDAVNNDELSW